MKKIILIIVAAVCLNSVLNAQIIRDSIQTLKPTNRELALQYLKKANTQKTIAIVSATAGTAIAMIGFALSFSGSGLTRENSYNESKYNTGVVLMYGGASMVVISIPLAIMSGHNKKKAQLFLSNENIGSTAALPLKHTLTSAGIAINF